MEGAIVVKGVPHLGCEDFGPGTVCAKEYVANTDQFDELYTPGLSGWQAQVFYLAVATCIMMPWCKFCSCIAAKMLAGSSREQAYTDRNVAVFKNVYNVSFGPRAARLFGLEVLCICGFQHFLGACLCAPYLFAPVRNYFGWDLNFCVFLARLGGVCEAGWEIGDLAHRIFEKFVLKRHDLQPDALLTLMCIHHFLGMSLVIPMNIFYGAHPLYIETVFNLQMAATLGLAGQQIGFMLDTSKEFELKIMRFLAIITFISMWWMRCIRYYWIWIMFALYFYALNNWVMLAAVLIAGYSMSWLNGLFCSDALKKLKKWWNMTASEMSKKD
jgi:hypothetical protein